MPPISQLRYPKCFLANASDASHGTDQFEIRCLEVGWKNVARLKVVVIPKMAPFNFSYHFFMQTSHSKNTFPNVIVPVIRPHDAVHNSANGAN